jgi:hypothetical protein
VSSRHERRRFRLEASKSLLTFWCEPTDPALMREPLLHQAANHWLDALSVRVRHCICCSCWLVDRQHVGALLLGTPAVIKANAVGTCGICRECWDADLGIEALERAATAALREALPNGRLAPLETQR